MSDVKKVVEHLDKAIEIAREMLDFLEIEIAREMLDFLESKQVVAERVRPEPIRLDYEEIKQAALGGAQMQWIAPAPTSDPARRARGSVSAIDFNVIPAAPEQESVFVRSPEPLLFREQGAPVNPVPSALEVLKKAFAADPHFAWTWHCNIACAVMDEGGPHDSANAAAARFMKAAFGVDTSGGPPK